MFVKERYELPNDIKRDLRRLKPKFGFGQYGEFLFYRTYSRTFNGKQETWADVVTRVIEGTLSIRKDWYIRNHIKWNEPFWDAFAETLSSNLFHMKWLPPGRGLWAMGTDYIYERGSMALYNCAFTTIGSDIAADVGWMMDCLMCGVGVGFEPIIDSDTLEVRRPEGTFNYLIPDSREGWVKSVELLIQAYTKPKAKRPIFDYSFIRGAGQPIRGFGGTSSGPDPLIEFHKRIETFFERYIIDPDYSVLRLKADLGNAIGCCVVAGNVRRTAEILLGAPNREFRDLKDYSKHPEREAWGWTSNNSVKLSSDADFNSLGLIAESVVRNGEPGFLNMKNLPQGRIGKNDCRVDHAIGINPCGEIPLEDKEVCNVAETNPTRCYDTYEWFDACADAAFYTTTVSMLPTHRPETNAVVCRNRRIGISITDGAAWKQELGVTGLTRALRQGYEKVRNTANRWNAEAGIPEPIRYTTIKPGGTVPKIAGCQSGFSHPNFRFMLRRVRVSKSAPIFKVLVESGFEYEDCVNQPENTAIFAFPISNGNLRAATEVSLWEQALNIVLIQREWADNAVSNTLNFRPKWQVVGKEGDVIIGSECDESHDVVDGKLMRYDQRHEEDVIENVLGAIAPLVKSVSLLPHAGKGVYAQMPEEELTEAEYLELVARTPKMDWSKLSGSDGQDTRFCDGDSCSTQ